MSSLRIPFEFWLCIMLIRIMYSQSEQQPEFVCECSNFTEIFNSTNQYLGFILRAKTFCPSTFNYTDRLVEKASLAMRQYENSDIMYGIGEANLNDSSSTYFLIYTHAHVLCAEVYLHIEHRCFGYPTSRDILIPAAAIKQSCKDAISRRPFGFSRNNYTGYFYRMASLRLSKFIDWAVEMGAQVGPIKAVYFGEDRGSGLVAKEFIRRNEAFLKIPVNLMFTAGWVADLPDYAPLLMRHRLEPFAILVLFFYMERQNPKSKYIPYLNVLPAEFTTPLAADIDNLNRIPVELLPARLRDLLEKQKKEFEDVKAQLTPVIGADELDLKLLNWAWHVVNTRCIYVENPKHPLVDAERSGDTIAIIPIVDLMNHSPNAQCVARFDKHSNLYCVAADYKGISPEDEVFVCYGPHDNARLWLEYGFCLPDNIFNRADIGEDLLIALAKKLGLDVTKAKERMIKDAGFPCTIYASDVSINFGLKKGCSIFLMDNNKLSNPKKILYSDEIDEDEVDPICRRILEALILLLRNRALSTPEAYRHFWVDQYTIVENLLNMPVDSDSE